MMEVTTEIRKSECEVLLLERKKDKEYSFEHEMVNICSSVGVRRQLGVQAWYLRLKKKS